MIFDNHLHKNKFCKVQVCVWYILCFQLCTRIEVDSEIFEYCFTYTLYQKLAPFWNKTSSFLIKGMLKRCSQGLSNKHDGVPITAFTSVISIVLTLLQEFFQTVSLRSELWKWSSGCYLFSWRIQNEVLVQKHLSLLTPKSFKMSKQNFQWRVI